MPRNESPRRRGTRRLPAALLALLVAWAGWSLGVETARLAPEVHRAPNPGVVADWRLTTPRAESLARFLHAMDARLPADRTVAFTTSEESLDQDYFLSLWAKYLMPRHRVVRLLPMLDLEDVEYVVAYNAEVDDPRLREVERHVSGVMYRVEGSRAGGAADGAEAAAGGGRKGEGATEGEGEETPAGEGADTGEDAGEDADTGEGGGAAEEAGDAGTGVGSGVGEKGGEGAGRAAAGLGGGSR